MKEIDLDVSVENGKYRFVYYADGSCDAFRYGEPWRGMTETMIGSKALAIYCLVARIGELEKMLSRRGHTGEGGALRP
jgi:hypothetical protein